MKAMRTILNLCVILALCLGLTPSRASAADGVTPPWSNRMVLLDHLGGYANAVAIDAGEQYAYFASGPRLVVADIHTAPGHVSGTNFSPVLRGDILAIALQGNYAFLAAEDAGMIVIDISDRANMHEVGAYYTGGQAKDIKVVGNLAYLADYYKGLVILNISDPARPTFVNQTRADDGSTFDERSAFFGIDVVGHYAYLSAYMKSMFVFDIANPAAPALKGSYVPDPVEYGGAWDVKVVGNYAYLAASSDLRILDISGSGNPVLITKFDTGSNQAISVSISGNMAYVAVNSSGVCQVNISNPFTPKTINGRSACSSTAPSDFFILPNNDLALSIQAGSRLYVGASTGLQIFTASAHSFTGGWTAEFSAVNDAAIYENRLYVADKLGLEILDASNPAIVLGHFTQGVSFERILLTKINNKTYVMALNGNGAVVIINVTDLAHITCVSYQFTQAEGGHGQDLALYGSQYLYVAAYSPGYLHIFDISDPDTAFDSGNHYSQAIASGVKLSRIQVFGYATLSIPGSPTLPHVTAYLAARENGLYIYDVSDPTHIAQKAHITTGSASGDSVNDIALATARGLLYLPTVQAIYLVQPYQITVLDGAKPGDTSLATKINLSTFEPASALTHQNVLYVSGGNEGIRAYDLTNPKSPILKGFYNIASTGARLQGVSDGSILTARWEAGIYRLALQNKSIFLPMLSKNP